MQSGQRTTNQPAGNQPKIDPARPSGTEGRWLTMQNAIAATGLTERTLRRYIKNQSVKCRRTGKLKNSPIELWITPEVSKFEEQPALNESDDTQNFDLFEESLESVDIEIVDPSLDSSKEYGEAHDSPEPAKVDVQIDSGSEKAQSEQTEINRTELQIAISTVTKEFLKELEKTNLMNLQLRSDLAEKERELRLLPDLQKQASDKELAELKSIALEKQINELKLRNEELEAQLSQNKNQPKKSWWKAALGIQGNS